MSTINYLIQQAISQFPENTAIKDRRDHEWTGLTYHALGEAIEEVGTGLISIGLKPGDKVGLFINSGGDWLISDLAILGSGAIDVPRGNDLASDELAYIARHAEIVMAITDRPLDTIPVLKREAPHLKYIVYLGRQAPEPGKNLLGWEELKARGQKALSNGDQTFRQRAGAVSEDDLATIVYTSGTTGQPKGVMLTHGNIAKNVLCTLQSIPIRPEERFLSLLPPYHMFERIIEYIALSSGACLIFSDTHNFRSDLLTQQPNFIAGVPRLWEMLYHGIMEKLKRGKYSRLASLLLGASKNFTRSRCILRKKRISGKAPLKNLKETGFGLLCFPFHQLADRLIYKKVRDSLGGSLELAVSGGGTLPPYLDDFFEMIGIALVNGYGLTETAPVLSMRQPKTNAKGTVGRPIPETEIKILDEHGKELDQGTVGIIWAKGPQVMPGYFKDPEATDKVLKDGWLNTGDLGTLTPEGEVIITGRAKDTIVLSSGKNIEPEAGETTLALSPYIFQVMLVGQDQKYPGALIVPDLKTIKSYCLQNYIPYTDRDELMSHPKVVQLIRNEIDRLYNKKETTRPWAKIVRFQLIAEEWTVHNGLLTFTLKKKRAAIAARYEETIQQLFH